MHFSRRQLVLPIAIVVFMLSGCSPTATPDAEELEEGVEGRSTCTRALDKLAPLGTELDETGSAFSAVLTENANAPATDFDIIATAARDNAGTYGSLASVFADLVPLTGEPFSSTAARAATSLAAAASATSDFATAADTYAANETAWTTEGLNAAAAPALTAAEDAGDSIVEVVGIFGNDPYAVCD